MKRVKDLVNKATDLRDKIGKHCADTSIDTPLYTDTRDQIGKWLQAHEDVLKEILYLREQIQATNLQTQVTIELEGKAVTKSITAWIHRRRDLATYSLNAYQKLTDRNLKEGTIPSSQGGTPTQVTIRRYFDPVVRDRKIEAYRTEPNIIDGVLETINATTDLIEPDDRPALAAVAA